MSWPGRRSSGPPSEYFKWVKNVMDLCGAVQQRDEEQALYFLNELRSMSFARKGIGSVHYCKYKYDDLKWLVAVIKEYLTMSAGISHEQKFFESRITEIQQTMLENHCKELLSDPDFDSIEFRILRNETQTKIPLDCLQPFLDKVYIPSMRKSDILRYFYYLLEDYITWYNVKEYRAHEIPFFIETVFAKLLQLGFDSREVYKFIHENITEFATSNIATKALQTLNSLRRALWPVLQTKVRSQSSIFKYVWDQFCKTFGSTDLEKYRQIATDLGIPNTASMNKAQLCVALNALKNQFLQEEAASCNPEEMDPWTMEDIGSIPPYRRYRIGNQCFDILSLTESIKQEQLENPFTRQPLPVDDITAKSEIINRMLNVQDDFYERIRDTPILSKQAILSQTLAKIWEQMKYPTSIENFLMANDEELANVVNEMSQYDVLNLSDVDILRFNRYKDKHEALADLMLRIIKYPQDEYTSTRHQAMEVALNNNIRSRTKRKRDNESNESSMIEYEDLDLPPSSRRRLE